MRSAELTYLGFKQVAPSPFLRPYVQCYWFIQRSVPLPESYEEWLYPDGGISLIFNLGDVLSLDGTAYEQVAFWDGPSTAVRHLNLTGAVNAIGIRFWPGGAYPFLALPLHEVANSQYTAADLGQKQMAHLLQQLATASSEQAQVMVLERWLAHRLSEVEVTAVVTQSLQMMQQTNGRLPIKLLAENVYLSRRQLERLYKMEVGMSPKQYGRILRVRRARDTIKQDEQLAVAEVGYDLGFYDQAHFTHEFKKIIGITPDSYRRRSLARRLVASDTKE